MKECPILFQTEMVRAIMWSAKTVTRRTGGLEEVNSAPDEYILCNEGVNRFGNYGASFQHKTDRKKDILTFCHYGETGDILYIRETYKKIGDEIVFKADQLQIGTPAKEADKWKPSLFMPKEIAKRWLKIVDINIERLHQISDADAVCEGICVLNGTPFIDKHFPDYTEAVKKWCDGPANGQPPHLPPPRDRFRALWESINGRDSWEINPWVWRIEFERLYMSGKPKNA